MQARRKFLKKTLAASLAVMLRPFRSLANNVKQAVKNNPYTIVLGRPTASSILMNFFAKQQMEVYIEYRKDNEQKMLSTPKVQLSKGDIHEFILPNLLPNQPYFYRIAYNNLNSENFLQGPMNSFHTQRKKGSDFIFTISADSHLGTPNHCNPELYQLTLDNIVKSNSDLHFSMGDDFRASKVNNPNYEKVAELYLNQREHLTTLCNSVPFFFVLGNHEMEAKAYADGTDNCLASWSVAARKKFVPNPVPDSFYTGSNNATDGMRQNYFAFEWGDVLFVTMDVFWYSNISAEDEEQREKQKEQKQGKQGGAKEHPANKNNKGNQKDPGNKKEPGKNNGKDQWAFTIGDDQYHWLKDCLQKSKAKYKIVFGHHVLGSCRGAIEWADKFEWGGNNRKGINEFAKHRPNWEMPIHDLFVKYKVNAFIQGHDHLFARQELNGVAYITCPMSGDPGYNTYNENAYLSGDKLSNTGHLKMVVTKSDFQMLYIKSVLQKDIATQGENGRIAYAWSFVKNKQMPII